MVSTSSLPVIRVREALHPTTGVNIPVFTLAGNLPRPLDLPSQMRGQVNEACYSVDAVANKSSQSLCIDVSIVHPVTYSFSFRLYFDRGPSILALAQAGQFGVEFATDPQHHLFTLHLAKETTDCMREAWEKTFSQPRTPRGRQGGARR